MKSLNIATLVVTLFLSSSVYASIISLSTSITEISNPASVEAGALESTTSSFIFAEQQSYALTSDLSVDLDLTGSGPDYGAGFIASGTKINSYFLHFDPLVNPSIPADSYGNFGQITFDTPILGVIWTGAVCPSCPSSPMNLDASDYLGAVGTMYPTNSPGRGYENDFYYVNEYEYDSVSVALNPATTIATSSIASPSGYDQLRIITLAPVPLPSAIWLFFSGFIGLIGIARRKKS